jgi:hypothetical protein
LEGSDTMTVDYRPVDNLLPTVVITHPAVELGGLIRQATVEVRGTAQDDVGVAEVRWSNQRGGSGKAFGTTEWIVPAVPLEPGNNVIVITAVDLAGNERRAELRLTVAPPDVSPPYVALLQPSAEFTYSSSSNTVRLRGFALDASGIADVTWTHARSPALRGVATGTSDWTIDEVPLFVGGNLITLTARDPSNNKASRQIFVTFFPSDVVSPVLIVAQREPNQTLVSQSARLALSGTAVDNVSVARVIWSTDGGAQGVAAGTAVWAIADIPLRFGSGALSAARSRGPGLGGGSAGERRDLPDARRRVSLYRDRERRFRSRAGALGLGGRPERSGPGDNRVACDRSAALRAESRDADGRGCGGKDR